MDVVLFFKKIVEVLLHFFNKILEPFLPWLNLLLPPPPPVAQNHRPFAIPDQVVREAAQQKVPQDLDWTMLLIAFCLTSAVEVLLHFFNKILEPFLPWLNLLPPPPPVAQNHRPFAIPDQVVREAAQQNVPQDLDWTMLLIAFCLTSAVDIALQSVQSGSNLPPCFHILSFSILLAFVSLFMAKFINPNSRMLCEALEKIGIFFAATAFFLAVTTAFPPWLKTISWAIYALSLLAIIICKLCNRH